ncbi:P-loop containing nucleoside triphosphate hydrolase protein [Gonapodya prolifera JEL478]|uniref:p-loop containing nucleoside triphosphate hydrolase protein n=1 Tax=Gonapodya prolifera (strain JEL478) TaxID=1344416 RepID=A0A139AT69_GONPJ|nr:P-loop containing nucleoside triphosphate hydrolase protein [Gonapodya prolifera JEL478]|eukprot:KXS19909.1 P-loop containing nucleoside triphosphate hydrolase protein [Gonapodya prolifera JEL478]
MNSSPIDASNSTIAPLAHPDGLPLPAATLHSDSSASSTTAASASAHPLTSDAPASQTFNATMTSLLPLPSPSPSSISIAIAASTSTAPVKVPSRTPTSVSTAPPASMHSDTSSFAFAASNTFALAFHPIKDTSSSPPPPEPHIALDLLAPPGPPPPLSHMDSALDGAGASGSTHMPTLRWSDVCYSVDQGRGKKRKQILFGLNGAMHNGELLALLGGSGSGKTTLLHCLSGRIPHGGHVQGEITFGGRDRGPATWPREYGFVESQDAHFVRLTAGEVLAYSATFRMRGATKQEREARCEEVAGELGLYAALDTPVGSPALNLPGLSTGQRKRLSLAVELLGRPRVLFLDEPTSGLDAFHALSVVEHLRMACRRGHRAAVVAVHQPRETMLELFDKVAVMAGGRTVYFGTVQGASEFFAKCGVPVPAGTNPADWWLDVSSVDTRDMSREKSSTARVSGLVEAWEKMDRARAAVSRGVSSRFSIARNYEMPQESYTLPWHVEMWELFKLSVTLVTRDPVLIRTKAFASVGLCFLFSLLFFRVDPTTVDGLASLLGALYLYQLSIAFQLGTHPITVFLTNRDVIRRERASFMYRSSTLFLARWIALLPLYGFFAIFEAFVFWLSIGLSDVGRFALTNILYTAYWLTMGLAIGALSPKIEVGVVLASMLAFVASCFSGYFASIHKLVPWSRYGDPAQFAMCMYGQSQFGDSFPANSEDLTGFETTCPTSLNEDLCVLHGYWLNFPVLLAFVVVGVAAGSVALKLGTRTRHVLT